MEPTTVVAPPTALAAAVPAAEEGLGGPGHHCRRDRADGCRGNHGAGAAAQSWA